MTLTKVPSDILHDGVVAHSAKRETDPNRQTPFTFCSRCKDWFKPAIRPDGARTVHYIAGSGEHGCLYDSCAVLRTLADAVESLAETFDLGRTRKATLKRDRRLELNPVRDGASYCEITSCDCATPWVHDVAEHWQARQIWRSLIRDSHVNQRQHSEHDSQRDSFAAHLHLPRTRIQKPTPSQRAAKTL